MTMTEKIKQMADRDLDALVAERVMGHRFWLEQRGDYQLAVGALQDGREPWMFSRDPQPERYTQVSALEAQRTGFFGKGIDNYSTDGSAMLEVLEAMRARGVRITIAGGRKWNVIFAGHDGVSFGVASHESLPRAVAEAAYEAIEAEKGEVPIES